ncbi:MAG: hypothetical protein GF375_03565, partial [Candidatus Omnitrophica bacterium]|nr:hypothetical protein [Candidatus Omnitrophota bacterium]MBD3269137.1 hypothetical protein [Candidatus Omnitrophota bacterium]
DLNTAQIDNKFQFIDLIKEIVSRMQIQQGSDSWRTFMELSPAHLGRTNVFLELTESDKLLINFIVSQAEAKEAINSYISDLQNILEGKGITLESCEVDVNPDFNFSRAPLWRQLLEQELGSKAQSLLSPFLSLAGRSENFDYREGFVLNSNRINCIA